MIPSKDKKTNQELVKELIDRLIILGPLGCPRKTKAVWRNRY